MRSFYSDFFKFGLAAFGTMLLGSHAVYTYYQPMSDFNDYVVAAEKRHRYKQQQALEEAAKKAASG